MINSIGKLDSLLACYAVAFVVLKHCPRCKQQKGASYLFCFIGATETVDDLDILVELLAGVQRMLRISSCDNDENLNDM